MTCLDVSAVQRHEWTVALHCCSQSLQKPPMKLVFSRLRSLQDAVSLSYDR